MMPGSIRHYDKGCGFSYHPCYISLSTDTLQWVELLSSRKKLWISRDVEIMKQQAGFIGLTFKEVNKRNYLSKSNSTKKLLASWLKNYIMNT